MDSKFYRNPISASRVKELAKSKRLIVRLVAGTILAAVILFGDHGIIQRIRLSSEKSALQEKIIEAQEESKRLRAQSRALDSDPKAIEKVAREKHGMIREGETVYKINKK